MSHWLGHGRPTDDIDHLFAIKRRAYVWVHHVHLDEHDYMCMSYQNHSSICDFSNSIDCHIKHRSQALSGSGNRLVQVKVKYYTMKVWLKYKEQESWAVAKMTARCGLYMGPWELSTVYLFTPMANFPDILMGLFGWTIPAQIWSP